MGSMGSIFDITADVQALEALIERVEEQEVPDQERLARLGAFLALKQKLLTEKVDAYVKVYRSLEATANAIREEEKHLAKLRRARENRMERLKEAVKLVSQKLGQPKLEGKTRSITVSTSKRPAIDITDQEAIPDDFKEQVISWAVDKKGIAEHVMTTGEVPPGVETRKVITVRFT